MAASIGAVAVAFLVLALAVEARLLLWALALLAVEYALVDLVHAQPLLAAPFYCTGLLLTGELTYARGDLRWTRLLAIAGAALTASFVAVLAAGVSGPGGVGAAVLALAAAAGLLGMPLFLLKRGSGPR